MSEHAQALMISTRVHALFGYTLGLAGVTRIIEICFFVPTFANSGVGGSALVPDDSNSDHTLADASLSPREPYAPTADSVIIEAKEDKSTAGKVFRHLPPFVSSFAYSSHRNTQNFILRFSFLFQLGTYLSVELFLGMLSD